MSYSKKFFQLKKEAHEMLLSVMSEGQVVTLFDMENKDYCEHDEFYELPQQFLYGKYGYAIIYYLHKVYVEEGKLYVEGFETEDGDDYTFDFDSLDVGNLVEIADSVRDNLNLNSVKENVHVGRISHRHGDNFYASRTRESLIKQIAGYCRDWWAEFCTEECPADDQEVIDQYFGEAEGVEYYEISETELE
jgi:hypothetical protein